MSSTGIELGMQACGSGHREQQRASGPSIAILLLRAPGSPVASSSQTRCDHPVTTHPCHGPLDKSDRTDESGTMVEEPSSPSMWDFMRSSRPFWIHTGWPLICAVGLSICCFCTKLCMLVCVSRNPRIPTRLCHVVHTHTSDLCCMASVGNRHVLDVQGHGDSVSWHMVQRRPGVDTPLWAHRANHLARRF